MPHTYVIIFGIVVLVAILGNIIPAGQFQTMIDPESGRNVVIPGSFEFISSPGIGFFDMFVAIQVGFIEAADIIFFIIFAYSFVHILLKNGAFNAIIGTLIRKLGDRVELFIPIGMLLFGVLGSTIGLFEEVYGLLPVFMALGIAIGFDGIVGASVVYIGVATGFAAATINPFTIGVAQQVAGLPISSGWEFRIVCFIVFMAIAISYVWWYARRIKKDPTKSILYGYKVEDETLADKEELVKLKLTGRQKLSVLVFVITLVLLIFGTQEFGWYINEIAALFLIAMIITGLISGYTPSEIADDFITSAKEMMFGALICGLSRAVIVVMQDAMIIDTVVYYLSNLLSHTQGMVSGIVMLFVQNVINLFIPSGSGQATVTMPIMASVADIVGVSRQTAVLAFQFGDGFSNMFWPTSVFMVCGMMRMPVDKWYKFVTPLFGLMLIAQMILLCIAVMIGYA